MKHLVSEHTVELLDRKYSFVINSLTKSFLLDLAQFISFLVEDELIKPYTSALLQNVNDTLYEYKKQLEEEKTIAVEVKKFLLEKYPELDDSDKVIPEDDLGARYTFTYFDRVVEQGPIASYPLASDALDDRSELAHLIGILRSKVNNYEHLFEGGEKKEIDEKVKYKLIDLEDLHKHTHLAFINYCRISAGVALYGLQELVKRINREPEDQTEWRALSFEEKLNRGFGIWHQETSYSWVTDAVYGVVSEYSNYRPNNLSPEQLEKLISDRKDELKRVYETIRQEIGTTRLHLQLLERYKIRCQWYNQEKLRSLVLTSRGELIRNREDLLTRDLALYIYDQGVTVLYRARLGQHEFDLVELGAPKHPMFIEAKAYKDSKAKAELISGVAQLHSYLSTYEAHQNLYEAYYVMFRLSGPIYEFPRSVQTNRFSIYPILVDLGLSIESGRHQSKPIIVSTEEILASIVAPTSGKGPSKKQSSSI